MDQKWADSIASWGWAPVMSDGTCMSNLANGRRCQVHKVFEAQFAYDGKNPIRLCRRQLEQFMAIAWRTR